MLHAVDHLASEGIIHRDVKPEKILLKTLPGNGCYSYQLANAVTDPMAFSGTTTFKAPEVGGVPLPQLKRTPAMDVSSLFVTLAYALDVASFRSKLLDAPFTSESSRCRRRLMRKCFDRSGTWPRSSRVVGL